MEILYEIREYTESDYIAFKKMLGNCFSQDYKIALTETQLERLCKDIAQQTNANIMFLDLLFLNGSAKGFINYQVDTSKSDWCEKENWGFIREAFVADDVRGNGWGRKLVENAENRLSILAVPNIYLTTDDSKDFWTKVGYRDTHEICIKNDGCIFVK